MTQLPAKPFAGMLPIVDQPPGDYVDRVGILSQPRVPFSRDAQRSAPLRVAAKQPLPMSRAEMNSRGWDEVDIVFVTGDAYVDHPSFAMALLGRLLEDEGFRVAILSQPDWHSAEPWKTFGKPRLFFAIS